MENDGGKGEEGLVEEGTGGDIIGSEIDTESVSGSKESSVNIEDNTLSGRSEGAEVLNLSLEQEHSGRKRTPSAIGDKINILLKAVGDAPILKNKLWAVPSDREVSQIIEFVRKYLKLDNQQSLFLFVNQAFAPSPDQPLKELYECFGADGKITLHYSTTYAWG